MAGTTACAAAELVGVQPDTSVSFYTRLRKVITDEMAKASPFADEVEVDESYFGGVRKGRRGRGTAGKVPVFGLLKRGGKVYTVMIPMPGQPTLIPIMERMILLDSIVYTDSFANYEALDISDFHRMRINHSEQFINERNHINGIERTRRCGIYGASMASRSRAFVYFCKSANGGSMAATTGSCVSSPRHGGIRNENVFSKDSHIKLKYDIYSGQQ